MKEKPERKYMYDAFISYRHAEPDKFIAENLHKCLEAFKPPKSVLKSGKASRERIERVFRDKEELPLTNNLEDPIVNALMQSEYLIVICSPRLKESVWCKKEIEIFKQHHGSEKVLAVLVEGEPEDSFPEELLYAEEYFLRPDGTQEVTKKAIEPLAADVRGRSKKEMLKALKAELLRLAAPMFSVSYDDLRQRHREKKLKKVIAVSVVSAVIGLMIGAVSVVTALRIKKQKEQIEKQADQIALQTNEIKEQNAKLLENQSVNLANESLRLLEEGDREGAVLKARQALTEYEGIKLPYTPEAKYALCESLYVYDTDTIMKAHHQLVSDSVIEYMYVSPDKNYAATYDEAGKLRIWEVKTGELITQLEAWLFSEKEFVFIDNNRVAYKTDSGEINIYWINEENMQSLSCNAVFGFKVDPNGNYLVVKGWNSQYIYDINTLELLYTYNPRDGYKIESTSFFVGDNIWIYIDSPDVQNVENDTATPQDTEMEQENNEQETPLGATLHFVDLSDGLEYAFLDVEFPNVTDIRIKGETAYILANNYAAASRSGTTCLMVCDIKTGSKLWEKLYEDIYIDSICMSYADGADELVIYSNREIFTIEEDTGKETARFTATSEIIDCMGFKSGESFITFLRDGSLCVITESKQYTSLEFYLDCKADNVTGFVPAADGFLVLPQNSNRITYYCTSVNPDLQPYEGEVVSMEEAYWDSVSERDFKAEAEELGLEKASLVTYILYSADASIIFVSYKDASLELYDASSMQLLETINEIQGDARYYLGEDNEGNKYISGAYCGYCFDADYNITARIQNLLAVDKENNRLIVGSYDEPYQIPVYSTQELLDMTLE
ncbi:MAG: toll/interleukin-1 receptor domain-containing protein [Clostridium sp.]|nr:toll/interleukin-1 receptor domain-containing protein [Clostridium sp.]MCM1208197.1 toll/interleukin-1 receptor domain-containing protein [Ruminococcus sp.]